MKYIIVSILLLLSNQALACSAPPITLMQSDDELVKRTPIIVLATVTKQTTNKHNSKFTFRSIKNIKGIAPTSFILDGYEPSENNDRQPSDDFKSHTTKPWQEGFTNSVMPGDCEAYGYFEKGKTYLIFIVKPTHVRAYEQILSDNDLWLKKVQSLVKIDNAPK